VTGTEPAEGNTGNIGTLTEFVKWAVGNTPDPATRYFLIMSGHGSGITDDFFLKDEDSMDSLTIGELRTALKDIAKIIRAKTGDRSRKIDIVGMDACLMSMGEIAYEIRKHADVLIAAEGLEAEFGWPYRRILARAQKEAQGRAGIRADRRLLPMQQPSQHTLSTSTSVSTPTTTTPRGDRPIWPPSG